MLIHYFFIFRYCHVVEHTSLPCHIVHHTLTAACTTVYCSKENVIKAVIIFVFAASHVLGQVSAEGDLRQRWEAIRPRQYDKMVNQYCHHMQSLCRHQWRYVSAGPRHKLRLGKHVFARSSSNRCITWTVKVTSIGLVRIILLIKRRVTTACILIAS